MTSRTRSETPYDQSATWQQLSGYSRPNGSCTTAPGAISAPGSFSVSGTNKTLYENRTMTDVVTPKFHKMQREGKIINNPLVQTYERYVIPKCSIDFYAMSNLWGCSPARYYNYLAHQVWGDRSLASIAGANLWKASTSIDAVALKNQAITQAFANIDTSEMLFLATLKELPSTVDGMVDIFKKVYQIVRLVRNTQKKLLSRPERLKSLFGALADLYLNARYNLRPLYYEAKAIRNVFNKTLSITQRQTFRSNISRSNISSDSVEVTPISHANFKLYTALSRTAARKVSVRAGVLTHVEALGLSDYLGLSQLIETAWDLTPFSFIIDWFINVGDTIASWTPNAKVRNLASWVCTRDTLIQTTRVSGNRCTWVNGTYYWTNVSGQVSGGTAERTYMTFTREPNYSLPVLPQFVVKLDPLKILDLVLIVGKLKQSKLHQSVRT